MCVLGLGGLSLKGNFTQIPSSLQLQGALEERDFIYMGLMG